MTAMAVLSRVHSSVLEDVKPTTHHDIASTQRWEVETRGCECLGAGLGESAVQAVAHHVVLTERDVLSVAESLTMCECKTISRM